MKRLPALLPGQLVSATCEELPAVPVARRQALALGPAVRAEHAQVATEIDALRQIELRQPPAPAPALGGSARVAFWNMERCKHVEASAALLETVAADVCLLCELDLGMARSGQRHTTRELARHLHQGYAFGVEFVELGLGNEQERAEHAGEQNAAGLHGGAIMSRSRLAQPVLVRLETSGDWFDGGLGERRVGGRIAIGARVVIGGVDVACFSVHFESHGDPLQRAAQMDVLLAAVEAYAGKDPVIIGGDVNCNTASFSEARDPDWRAAAAAEDPSRFVSPMRYEPMFDAAAAAGFDWHACNRSDPTRCRGRNGPARWPGRVDWFFTRGLVAEDTATVPALGEDEIMLSDHELIAVTVRPSRASRSAPQGQGT